MRHDFTAGRKVGFILTMAVAELWVDDRLAAVNANLCYDPLSRIVGHTNGGRLVKSKQE